ncbi:hypothetical protein GW17_00059030 [Ensete ventricosum]|nr:hypothetical protein GW17_00059030 [Ensete ventricosum]
MWIPLERMTLDLLHPLYPDLEIQGYTISLMKTARRSDDPQPGQDPLQGGVIGCGQGQPTREASGARKGRSRLQGQQPTGVVPAGRSATRGHSRLQRDTRKGLPPATSPTVSKGGGVGRRGGCHLAERLPVGKCNRHLRTGNDDGDDVEGARGVRASFLEKDDLAPMNSENSEDCPLIQNYENTLNYSRNFEDCPLIQNY